METLSRRTWLQAALAAGAQDLSPRRPNRGPGETPPEPVFDRVTLEVSLKPFFRMEEPAIDSVCRRIFRQWSPLLGHARSSAVMLWTADGSEILDYRGRLEDEIEWGRYIGIANPPAEASPDDPERLGLHARPWLYIDDPPRITYRWLRVIVQSLKRAGTEITGKPVMVGATFDPGPEFARSPFKYERHPEISQGRTMGQGTWVVCSSVLKGDSVSYAGFPNGIPEGTPLGVFLGRQTQRFLSDLGFDYIWFSNGFGFSLESWRVTGILFDGQRFDPAPAGEVRSKVIGFWKHFRRECPNFPIETRGSNLSVGSDLATHASPVRDIYEGGFGMVAPPNSPWAAINGDFGLEIAGYLSRIANLPPGGKFPFRYYTHDPWWLNSPWFDRYGREPHDIYLPLALARVGPDGGITRPAYLELLTIDNSFGQMPDRCPIEVTPHILAAMDHYSDAPGPVTWIYPFREFHEMIFAGRGHSEIFFGDWLMRGAINSGFPLNTVVSTDNFLASLQVRPEMYRDTVLLTPIPAPGEALERALLECLRRGHDVLFYGPVTHAGPELLELLNLRRGAPLSGEVRIETPLEADTFRQGGLPNRMRHRGLLSGGGIDTLALRPSLGGFEVCAAAVQGGEERLYALLRRVGDGRAGWIRGSVCCSIGGGHLPVPDSAREFLQGESLLRRMLARFGYVLSVEKPSVETRDPLILAARSRNGFFLSGYSPSTAASVRLKFPHGAPLLTGAEAWIEGGRAVYSMPRAWHREARCFLEQATPGEVSCVERHSGEVGIRRRLFLRGLKDATLHFYREPGPQRVILSPDQRPHNRASLPYRAEDGGARLVAERVTGELLISW